jgi:uncharacterized protein
MSHFSFSCFEQIASGSLPQVYAASSHIPGTLIFEQETGRVIDIDPRFPPRDDGPRPGRPKLGVTPREITLLPRHWDWLATQPGGASVALRKLVEEASRSPKAQHRKLRDAAYRFATTLVGNAPGYEEAIRALYAGQRDEFAAHIEAWPADVRRALEEMTQEAF